MDNGSQRTTNETLNKGTAQERSLSDSSQQAQFHTQPPTVELPQGGGAIRSMGEKFAANPVTGTASMNVPIASSAGRAGFAPQLALGYDSASGNGSFGFGWSVSLPSVSRKTDKGLPQYRQQADNDVFVLSGAEDLVPMLDEQAGRWENLTLTRTVDSQRYSITRYRPRIEGLFALIEYWENQNTPGDCFWRSISKDNVTTWYGKSTQSRIADPENSERVFSWLICQTYDAKGNVIDYEYKSENSNNVDVFQPHERHRSDVARSANRYIKRIKYGNASPYFPNLEPDRPVVPPSEHWFFELVFDYGEHDADEPTPLETDAWNVRHDAFSSYRSGFEIRTYRLCQRVLMFHHFDGDDIRDQDGVGKNYLVRSTDIAFNSVETHHPSYSTIDSITHTSWRRKSDGTYTRRSVPPITFRYSQAVLGEKIETAPPDSLENLPKGVDGGLYKWVDLNGEGLTGVLTEQAGEWFYKPNESTVTRTLGIDGINGASDQTEANNTTDTDDPVTEFSLQLGSTHLVSKRPIGDLGRHRQFIDIDGNGQLDLVQFSSPMSGFYERNQNDDWERFLPFRLYPNIDWQDANLTFMDLTGDGHVDAVITEADVLTWYPSLAKDGFAASKHNHLAVDEADGPRVLFSDAEETVFLSDFSGDGLTDIVRIRNGDICYWPNVGYGQFGKKITMTNAPWFDEVDQFSPQRIRLTDVDGSGTIDILYLGREQTNVYFNLSGNAWSPASAIDGFPRADNLTEVTAVDLLGNGTACLVWSSPLPNNQGSQIRYIELMAKGKPHLLLNTNNNLGGETSVTYLPSTYFYLKDKLAGTPWVTRLPFPVHVVEQVVVTDKWRKTRFSTHYTYHHGYFDGQEREFRGFGRVEHVDTESYDTFDAANTNSPFISDDKTLYQPPIKTVTWYHTGAAIDREKILDQYTKEYFPNNLDAGVVESSYQEVVFPQPDLSRYVLSSDEWLQAMRACKGMPLRQEIYELDAAALAQQQQHTPIKLYSAVQHNCEIKRLQPKADNLHAVFFVAESESITHHYELDLQIGNASPDPRTAHSFNINIDDYGNVLQAVSVVYPRLNEYQEAGLDSTTVALINEVQSQQHMVYTENHFTHALTPQSTASGLDQYHLPLPCQVQTYELTGLKPLASNNEYITRKQLLELQLSTQYPSSGHEVERLNYEQTPNHRTLQKRLTAWSRLLYFSDDLSTPLALGELNSLALPYETYRLALTERLLDAILDEKITPSIRADLQSEQKSGYLSTDELASAFPDLSQSGQYWVRSGIAGFADDTPHHFYFPNAYTDAFGNTTTVQYDARDLYIESSSAPAVVTTDGSVINTTRVTQFNYRVLAAQATMDINANLSDVVFDTLGLPIAAAIKGKGDEGDHLDGFNNNDNLLDINSLTLINFFDHAEFNTQTALSLLDTASTRHVYDFGETRDSFGNIIAYAQRPAGSAAIVREQHTANLSIGQASPIQVAFEYSDAGGNILVTKSLAEPEEGREAARWVASGKTILNNKGKPVKQYEPYFSERETAPNEFVADHRFEEPHEIGVTPIMYYDSVGRLIRTDLPDGSLTRTEFSPWHAVSYDQNDTVLEPDNRWYQRMSLGSDPERKAAEKAAKHANTPSMIFLDSLGREVIAIAHNRVERAGREADEKYVTHTKLNVEGKPLWIKDARHNVVMRYTVNASAHSAPTRDYVPAYDMAGNALFQHSMDAGDRWLINNAHGQPFYAWDENERTSENGEQHYEFRLHRRQYDALRRPLKNELQINEGDWRVIERWAYGETIADQTNAHARNLRGQLYQHFDPSGVVTNQTYDFKGNLLSAKRQLTSAIKAEVIHWPEIPASGTNAAISELLEAELLFSQQTRYDALNRMVWQANWHLERPDVPDYSPPSYIPQYNQRGALQREELIANGELSQAISNIVYDAKGQRQQLVLGNGTVTNYQYDTHTFRLKSLTTHKSNKHFQDLHYTYDAVGNVTDIKDHAHQTVYFRNRSVEPHHVYEYDALYRLINAQGREHAAQNNAQRDNTPFLPTVEMPFLNSPEALQRYTQTYEYDAVGNLLNMSHAGGDTLRWKRFYQYAQDSNRLLATSSPGDRTADLEHYADIASPMLSVPYRYDTHASMLNVARTSTPFDMHWDYRDMVHHVNLGGGGHAFYNYDATKQRTRKRLERNGNVVEERFYLGGMELYRRSVDGEVLEEIETYHLFATDDRVLMVENVIKTDSTRLDEGVLYRYQYSNHLGSVGLELNADADVMSYEEYHPYGTTAYCANNKDIKRVAKRYKYTGMERDEETGLSYHTARYYLPWLGRWGSSDPIGIKGGGNLFRYSNNSPVVNTDITGLQPEYSVQDMSENFGQEFVQNNISTGSIQVDQNGESSFGGYGARAVINGPQDDSALGQIGRTLRGFASGLVDSAVNLVKGIGQAIIHPIDTGTGLVQFAGGLFVSTDGDAVPETLEAIWAMGSNWVEDFSQAMNQGDEEEAGNMTGRLTGNLALLFVGGNAALRANRVRAAGVAEEAAHAAAAAEEVAIVSAQTLESATALELSVANETAEFVEFMSSVQQLSTNPITIATASEATVIAESELATVQVLRDLARMEASAASIEASQALAISEAAANNAIAAQLLIENPALYAAVRAEVATGGASGRLMNIARGFAERGGTPTAIKIALAEFSQELLSWFKPR